MAEQRTMTSITTEASLFDLSAFSEVRKRPEVGQGSVGHDEPTPVRAVSDLDLEGLRAELQVQREVLGFSFAALAAAVDRPVSTVHGWLAGTHAPYPRDRETFEQVLTILGVQDVRMVSQRLVRGRRNVAVGLSQATLLDRLERLERRILDLESTPAEQAARRRA